MILWTQDQLLIQVQGWNLLLRRWVVAIGDKDQSIDSLKLSDQ